MNEKGHMLIYSLPGVLCIPHLSHWLGHYWNGTDASCDQSATAGLIGMLSGLFAGLRLAPGALLSSRLFSLQLVRQLIKDALLFLLGGPVCSWGSKLIVGFLDAFATEGEGDR